MQHNDEVSAEAAAATHRAVHGTSFEEGTDGDVAKRPKRERVTERGCWV